MGVTQAAGLSLNWFRGNLAPNMSYGEIDKNAAALPIGCDKLIYLPYLMGERSPILDSNARGVFFGLSAMHTASHMARAVIEGVSYSLYSCLEVIREVGIDVSDMALCGGGGKSPFWQQMLADIYNIPIKTMASDEGAALGAAILAGCCAGVYPSVEAGCEAIVKDKSRSLPRGDVHNTYMQFYRIYDSLYTALKNSFMRLSQL